MKDPRLDPNKTLIRMWAMMDPAEREAIVEYFVQETKVSTLADTLTKWTAVWTEELRKEKGLDPETGEKLPASIERRLRFVKGGRNKK